MDITGLDSYITQLEKIKKQLANYSSDDAFKIVLVGQVDAGVHIDLQSVTNRLDHLFYAKVVDKTVAKIDEKKLGCEKSLRGEFFRVVSALDLSEEDKQQVLKLGLGAIEGVVEND